jgi:hypothetical protein
MIGLRMFSPSSRRCSRCVIAQWLEPAEALVLVFRRRRRKTPGTGHEVHWCEVSQIDAYEGMQG